MEETKRVVPAFLYRAEPGEKLNTLKRRMNGATTFYTEVMFYKHYVTHATPKGFWVYEMPGVRQGKRKFVLEDSTRSFAHKTKLQALNAFARRNARNIQHLEWEMEIALKKKTAIERKYRDLKLNYEDSL